jgi:hypothetical protein
MSRYGFDLTVLVLGAVAVTVSGCGPKFTFIPVEGTVTKGGRPLRDIEVVFLADPDEGTLGPRATGRTDEAGHYRLRTDSGDDGAVAGKHRVVILDLEASKKQVVRSFRGRPSPEMAKRLQEQQKTTAEALRVPPHYASISDTPLRAEVRPEAQVIDLEVK